MADNTKIEWTDATWNPITGCSIVSPGCTNCYAMKLAGTRLKHHPSRAGLTNPSKAGPVWNGKVTFNEKWLDQPLRWKKPRMIFVCAHGDLFAENVPDEWIDKVFAVMALCPQHTFQVLTKRADRMREYMQPERSFSRIEDIVMDRAVDEPIGRVLIAPGSSTTHAPKGIHIRLGRWPLPNVWLGVSVEDQTRADERIPALLDTPAAVRFISAEPLLGPVDLTNWLNELRWGLDLSDEAGGGSNSGTRPPLDWVIVGGESGQSARDWEGFTEASRSLRDQCKASDVAFFMKQMPKKATIPSDLIIREFPNG